MGFSGTGNINLRMRVGGRCSVYGYWWLFSKCNVELWLTYSSGSLRKSSVVRKGDNNPELEGCCRKKIFLYGVDVKDLCRLPAGFFRKLRDQQIYC